MRATSIAALATGLLAAVSSEGAAQRPSTCAPVAVDAWESDRAAVESAKGVLDARILALLPSQARGVARAAQSPSALADGLLDLRRRADVAFTAASLPAVSPGFVHAFNANLDTAITLLRGTGPLPEVPLERLDAGRFSHTSVEMDDGTETSYFFRMRGDPVGFRIDSAALGTPALEAACWALLSAEKFLDRVAANAWSETAKTLREIQAQWDGLASSRRAMTPLEYLVNRVTWSGGPSLHPPHWQWILLHPVAAFTANGVGEGSRREASAALELFGFVRYRRPERWQHFVGLSVVGVTPEAGPAALGLYAHLSRYGSIGAVQRVAGDRRVSLMVSAELARFLFDRRALDSLVTDLRAKAQSTLRDQLAKKAMRQ